MVKAKIYTVMANQVMGDFDMVLLNVVLFPAYLTKLADWKCKVGRLNKYIIIKAALWASCDLYNVQWMLQMIICSQGL